MLEYKKGSIFDSGCEAIVNPVNCVGVMGGGLAAQFKVLYPEMYKEYVQFCSDGTLKIGRVHIWEENSKKSPAYIVNFPTKDDWKNHSKVEYIAKGLADLRTEIIDLNIRSVAIPALGCGLGGLSWNSVKLMIESFHETLPNHVKVLVYEPLGE